MANERHNEDQEQITNDEVVGKAAGEDQEFEDADEPCSSVLFRHARQVDAFRVAQFCPQIAHLFQPGGHRLDREILPLHAIINLLPRQRRRDAGIIARPRTVSRRQRLAEDVLQVVDINARTSRADASFDGRDLRMLLRHDGCDDLAEEQAGIVRGAGGKRHVDVKAVSA